MKSKLLLSATLAALILASSANAKSQESNETASKNIINLLKTKGGVDNAKVIDSMLLYNGIKLSTLEDKAGMQFPILSSSDGNLILPFSMNTISTKEGVEAKVKDVSEQILSHNKTLTDKHVIGMLQGLPDNAFLRLENGKSKTIIIVSDPECPYCRKELESIELRLQDANIYMVFAPVHGKSAFIKSDLIYQKASKAQSNQDKIAIIKQYYDPNYKLSDDEMKLNPEITQNNAKVIFGSKLIQGVPFSVEVPSNQFKKGN